MDDVSLAEKQCKSCLGIYPATPKYFNKKKTGRYGFMGICKVCRSAQRNPGSNKVEHIKARMLAPDGFIKCVGCGEIVPEDRDHVQWNKADGFYSRCLPCHRARNKEAMRRWCKKHPEVARKRSAEAMEKWKQADPEGFKAVRVATEKNWILNNPERRREIARDWARNNPSKTKANSHKRIARQKAAPGSHTAEQLLQMLEDQEGRCAYCEVDIREGWSTDHMQPLSRGGRNDWTNLALACLSCNLRKNAKTAIEYMDYLMAP